MLHTHQKKKKKELDWQEILTQCCQFLLISKNGEAREQATSVEYYYRIGAIESISQ